MGWRIEFRPMDLQMNDFGNAALVVFLALITRVIISYDLDFTMPISQVNENMNTAHRRDAIRQEKFHFRCGTDVSLLYINEIINGTNDFPGLVPLVRRYITEREDIDTATRHTLEQYLLLVSKRAAGKSTVLPQSKKDNRLFIGTLLTNAAWMRQFVLIHPLYKHDSIVSEEIQYDLVMKMQQIENHHEDCPSIKHPKMNTQTNLHAN